MYLQQLIYVVKVAECQSMSKAGEELYVSQAGISKSIMDLEQEMGIKIFKRFKKGIIPTNEGLEFISYARQIVEQIDLLEYNYKFRHNVPNSLSISTQHYAFSVNAFANVLKSVDAQKYDVTLKETRTHEIIEDVANLKSNLGILYINDFNKKILLKCFKDNNLLFHPLFKTKIHVFINKNHPLSTLQSISLEDLENYPFLCFEQGDKNSLYFSEEILNTVSKNKLIHVSDRATLFNLLIGLNGYTICTGIINSDLNGNNIISIPLNVPDTMTVGYITKKNIILPDLAKNYIIELTRLIQLDGYNIIQEINFENTDNLI